jgi:hypothetical protein
LYKYLTEEAVLRLLSHLTVRFSPPQCFNDPFEMKPALTDAGLQQIKERRLDPGPPGGDECLRLVLGGFQDRTISKSVASRIGMLCLSETERDILMWSHYGDNHRGAVVEFDVGHPFFSALTFDGRHQFLRQVIYSEQRASLGGDFCSTHTDYDNDGTGYKRLFEEAHPIFFTKSLHWSYEKEWRLVRQIIPPWQDPPVWWRNHDAAGLHPWAEVTPQQICAMPTSAITRIILGAVCRLQSDWGEYDGLEEEVLKLIKARPDTAHIAVHKAHVDPISFSLEVIDLDSASEVERHLGRQNYVNRVAGFTGRPPQKP